MLPSVLHFVKRRSQVSMFLVNTYFHQKYRMQYVQVVVQGESAIGVIKDSYVRFLIKLINNLRVQMF